MALREPLEPLRREPVRGQLRAQVGLALPRAAHPASELVQQRGIEVSCPHELGGRDHDALLRRASVESAGMLPGTSPPTSA